MAVVNDFNKSPDDDQSQNNQGQSQADQFANKPVGISGTSASESSGTSPSAAAPTIGSGQGTSNQSNPTSSGRFTNLVNYLGANKDYNSQGGGLAGQITNKFQNQGSGIQTDINNAQDQFTQQATQGTPTYNADLMNQATSDPNAFIQNTDNLNNFAKQRDATYTGPSGFDTDYGLRGKADNLQSTANLTNSESGRYALLSKMFGKPSYSSGAQSLDNLLLQGNPSQLGMLQNVSSVSNNLNNNINDKITQDQIAAQQNAVTAQNTQNSARDALTQAISNYDTTNGPAQQQAYNSALTAVQNQGNDLQNLINNNKISPEFLAQYGLTPNMNIYNVPTQNYYTPTSTTPTLENVVSPADLSRIQALGTLSGNKLSADTNDTLAKYINNTQAGGYQDNHNFNTSGFLNAINNAQNNYNSQLGSLQGQVASAQQNLYNLPINVGSIGGVNVGDPNGLEAQKAALQNLIQSKNDAIASLNNQYTPGKTLGGTVAPRRSR